MLAPDEIAQLQRQMAEHIPSMTKGFRDALRIQAMYGKQLGQVSDAIMSQIKAIEAVTKGMRVDFPRLDVGKLLAPQFDLTKLAWPPFDLPKLDLTWVEEALRRAHPSNWEGLNSTEVYAVLDLMEDTGWCLVWAPSADVIQKLLAEPDAEARLERLIASKLEIAQDLRTRVGEVHRVELGGHRKATIRAIEAFLDGHVEAAQALAASVISALIGGTLGLKFAVAREQLEGDPMEESINNFRQRAVFNMVARSLQQYFAELGEAVPTSFSRHADSSSPQATHGGRPRCTRRSCSSVAPAPIDLGHGRPRRPGEHLSRPPQAPCADTFEHGSLPEVVD